MRARYQGEAPLSGRDALLRLAALSADLVEIRFTQVGGRSVLIAADTQGRRRVEAEGAPLSTAALVAAASHILPDIRLRGGALLTAYDAYWYPHHDARVLPVLRLRFADPAGTWVHLDPETGELLNRLDRSGRANRWLFDGIHRLDFAILFHNRPAWDAVLWTLSALAAVIALTGVAMGWRRLRR
ncbi:hypothetical protein G3T14_23035 [Methylobacterium sp. BTF04]|nr:hypothetical protein [Methylobacterium sp. BTF04]